MRKIRIFLSMLAVVGVLFATSSCVDNTESESVNALRNAKAAELTAQAQHLRDADAIERIRAEAEAVLLNAQATTQASVAALNAAQGRLIDAQADAAILNAEADKLRAESDKLRAEGDKAVSEAQAKHFEAQAKELEVRAENLKAQALADAEVAAENLRNQKYQNDILLAGLESKLQAAELEAKRNLLQQQQSYILAVSNLDIQVATKYATLIGQLTTTLNEIETLQEQVAGLELNIAQYQSDLSAYSVDSARFVKKYIAQTEAAITIDNLRLNYAERQLVALESYDTGLETLKEQLEVQKAYFEKDTLEKGVALEAAKALVDVLVADTVEKAETFAAAKETFDAADAAYKAAQEAVTTAQADYNAYVALTGGGYYNYVRSNYIENSDWTYYSVQTGQAGYGSNYWTRPADGRTYYAPSDPYSYYDGQEVTVYTDNNIEVTCVVDLNYLYDGQVDYQFYVYQRSLVVSYYEYQYTSAEDYEHRIQLWKQISIDVEKTYTLKAKELSDSLLSLKALGLLEREYYGDLQDSIAYLDEAIIAKTAAEKVYVDARDKYIADPTQENSDALDDASIAYNGIKESDGSIVDETEGAAGEEGRAYTYHSNAQTKHYEALRAYNNTNNRIKILIPGVIDAKNEVTDINAVLAPAYDNLVILQKGTREQLQFALDAAEEAIVAPRNAYYEARDLYNAASYALQTAKYAYLDHISITLVSAKDAYKAAIDAYSYIEDIEFQISLGGIQYMLNNKANLISSTQQDIADYEARLTKNQSSLEDAYKDVAKYAYDSSKGNYVAKVIENYKKQIADAQKDVDKKKVEIAQKQQLADSQQTAIDILLKEYESLNE
jgi:hypothetical protein